MRNNMFRQRVESVQHAMFTWFVDTSSENNGNTPDSVTVGYIAKRLKEDLGISNGLFRVTSIIVYGVKGGTTLCVQDAINRDIIAENNLNAVKVPLFDFQYEASSAGTSESGYLSPTNWININNVTRIKDLRLARIADYNNAVGLTNKPRIEVSISFFKG